MPMVFLGVAETLTGVGASLTGVTSLVGVVTGGVIMGAFSIGSITFFRC